MNYRDILIDSFRAAVAAADPARIVPAFLPTAPKGRTLVVGAGKAAAAMAAAVEQHWPRDSALSGTVITRYGHSLPTKRIRVVEAGHPVPDAASPAVSRPDTPFPIRQEKQHRRKFFSRFSHWVQTICWLR